LERVSLNSIIYSLFEIHDKEDISDCVTPRTKAFDGVTALQAAAVAAVTTQVIMGKQSSASPGGNGNNDGPGF